MNHDEVLSEWWRLLPSLNPPTEYKKVSHFYLPELAFWLGVNTNKSTIDQLTQDLANAQAEIARLMQGMLDIIDEHYPYANSLSHRDCNDLLASIGNRLNALSQSSPPLKEYRDMKADAERYRRIRENWLDCDELELHGRLAVIDNRIDELRGKSC